MEVRSVPVCTKNRPVRQLKEALLTQDDLYGGDLYGDPGGDYDGGFGDMDDSYLPGTSGQVL